MLSEKLAKANGAADALRTQVASSRRQSATCPEGASLEAREKADAESDKLLRKRDFA